MNDDSQEYMLRFRATDWDRETAKAMNDYLRTVEPDPAGQRPAAYVDEPVTGWLGIHVFPLDKYSDLRRGKIVQQCLNIRSTLAHQVTLGQAKPYSPAAE